MRQLSDDRHGWTRGIVLVLAGLLALNPGVGWTSPAGPNSALAAAALVVESDPAGANVYVDGELAGSTPLQMTKLAAGDHRVRVVKDGYLENARIVTLGSDQPKNVRVKLTPHAGPAPAAQVTGGGGSSKKKWMWIGIAGGAAAVTAIALAGGNDPPVPGTIGTNFPTGLASTSTTFTVTGASDPDGDTITFDWDFGDGTQHETGQSPVHVYNSTGTFTVTLTARDSHNATASTTTTFTVRNLSGTWRGPLTQAGVTATTTITLTQNGASLSGSYSDNFGISGSVAGSLSQLNRQVTFTANTSAGGTQFAPFTFVGNVSNDITTLTGTANGSGFSNASWVLTR